MNHHRLHRRATILADFSALRSPDEGLLRDEDYATLIENFEDTRDGDFTDAEAFSVVAWADFTALSSRSLDAVIRGEAGVEFDEDGQITVGDAPPTNLLATAVDRVPGSPETGDVGVAAARLAFVAGRLNEERRWSDTELAEVETWAQTASADRALLDLLLAYPDLGLDVSDAGRVVVIAAGRAP